MQKWLNVILAAACRGCPVCIMARRRPDGRLARIHAGLEKMCPACRAYAKVKKLGAS